MRKRLSDNTRKHLALFSLILSLDIMILWRRRLQRILRFFRRHFFRCPGRGSPHVPLRIISRGWEVPPRTRADFVDPVRDHLALTLDGYFSSQSNWDCGALLSQQPRRLLGALDPSRKRTGFHPRGRVDRISQYCVLWQPGTNDAGNGRA